VQPDQPAATADLTGPGAPRTSLRARATADTLARAGALRGALGISECVDATLHDQLGVPVWFSVTPGTRCRPRHAGKGVRPIDAQTGALMEALEIVVAERADVRPPIASRPLGELVAQLGAGWSIADLAPRFGAPATPDRAVPVDACEDLATGRPLLMPAELLRLLPPEDADPPLFACNSNGLASGNTLAEATLHALLEVIERDTVALHLAAPHEAQAIDTATLPEPFAGWARRWTGLGVTLHLRALPNAFGLTTLTAELHDADPTAPSPMRGHGCHPDAGIALARAVTEAAQSRLWVLRFPASLAQADRVSLPAPGGQSFGTLRSWPAAGIDETLAQLLARLREAGLPWVLRRHLNRHADAADLDGLHVVKLLVPGCESALAGPLRIGRRLAQRLVRAPAAAR
jgi:ribosomal protein S12 methylthiotransferase accessory factor